MTITAEVIADSISPEGIRLTTMQLRYPRFIHSEFMTHRVFSRNASSSRAIPVQRMIEDLRRDPAMPVYWGSNKPGMQAGEELEPVMIRVSKADWIAAMENAIESAQRLMTNGLHKQIANRILEPWAHINVIVTATQWENFFALRAHADAQPEIRVLALEMLNAIAKSQPTHMRPGVWHLPYVRSQDYVSLINWFKYGDNEIAKLNGIMRQEPTVDQILHHAKLVSVARCARVSYLTHDGRETTVEEDLALAEKLIVAAPLHASPAEHQATPDWYDPKDAMMSRNAAKTDNLRHEDYSDDYAWQPQWANPHLHANLIGWQQFRKTLPNEFVQN